MTRPLTITDLSGTGRRQHVDGAMRGLLFAMALVSVLITGLIVWTLGQKAWQFLTAVDLSQLHSIGWFPRRGNFDISTLLVGSFIVTVIAMSIAVPVGLGSAVYLSEFASNRVRRVLKPLLEVLSGIPSVVVGLFALSWIAPNLVQRFTDAGIFSLLCAGIGVGVLTIPLVASVSEDSLRSVPNTLREASYGVGATKRTTVTRIVLPAGISGLMASFILAASRAIGETLVVAMAAGGSGGSLFNWHPTKPGQTMTGAMTSLARGTDQVAGAGAAYQSLFFVGAFLFVITLVLNLIANHFVERVRLRY